MDEKRIYVLYVVASTEWGGLLALAVGGGREVGAGCRSGGGGKEGLERRGGLQREQDGGCVSFGVTGISTEQPHGTDFYAPNIFHGKRIFVLNSRERQRRLRFD